MKGRISFPFETFLVSHDIFLYFSDLELKVGTMRTVEVKPETRNHKGFFVQDAAYHLVGIEDSGWALICIDDAVCHYVDPDNLELPTGEMNNLG